MSGSVGGHPLFRPLALGELELPNRVVMAPLTRGRASEAHVPTRLMANYYAQRAAAGLIVTEATAVDPLGMGWYRAPGIWDDKMVGGWREVTGAVHAAGGRIAAQLWHMGRLVLPDYLNGKQPIGPSQIGSEGETIAPPPPGADPLRLPMKPYAIPRCMNDEDIAGAVRAYGKAAENALSAGFDAVEIHGANGYLIDQFLKSGTNVRQDGYGGSLARRTRFLEEVIAAITKRVSPGRVGLRISPTSARKGMGDENPGALTEAVGAIAQEAGLAYVHLIEPVAPGFMDVPDLPVMKRLRASYGGAVIQNGGFGPAEAARAVGAGEADAISFGRPFIANPDLVRRIRDGLPLNTYETRFAYVGDARGYTDYPALPE